MSRIHIRGGKLLDPTSSLDKKGDLFIADGDIVSIHKTPDGFKADITIDAKGQLVCPGIVDLAARTREPGLEYKANIASESLAACASGITTLCTPPDTEPVIDEPSVIELIDRQASNSNQARVLTLGALTLGLEGQLLSEMATLKQAGCVGVSNARRPIQNTSVRRRAYSYAATFDLTVFIEADDHWLSDKGCASEGAVATRLGLPGIPVSAETSAIASDLALIEEAGVRAHFCRLSTARAVEMIAEARARGLPVSADVSAHQLHLTDMDINSFNSACHVIPPLRTERDKNALREGIRSGVIDAICSDHQPHEADAKQAPFEATQPGISALDSLLPLTLKLVSEGHIPLNTAISALTGKPAAIIGTPLGSLASGKPADVIVIDMGKEWELATLASRGQNSPFLGWEFVGKVSHTIVDGDLKYSLN